MVKRLTNHFVLTFVIVVPGDSTLPTQICVMTFSLEMFETKYFTFQLRLLDDLKRSCLPLTELFLERSI